MNYKTKTVDGKLVAEVTLEVEVPKHWIEHCLSSDVFRSDYSGTWARGVEHDEKLGWLVFDKEHGSSLRITTRGHESGREEAFKAWRGIVVGAVVTYKAADAWYKEFDGRTATVLKVGDETSFATVQFDDGYVADCVENDELIINFPPGWYRLDEAAAVKAYLHGVRRWGEKWEDHSDCDGLWYDIVLQLALLGEVRYG